MGALPALIWTADHPDEVAGLAVYLCSDLASFLTGADIPFDGGVLNLRG